MKITVSDDKEAASISIDVSGSNAVKCALEKIIELIFRDSGKCFAQGITTSPLVPAEVAAPATKFKVGDRVLVLGSEPNVPRIICHVGYDSYGTFYRIKSLSEPNGMSPFRLRDTDFRLVDPA